jgi:glycosyltransferase involved in cell wall biosynthesis
MKPSISVIVTTFNVENYVDRALSSVLDQGFQKVKVIVVDDGSSDDTLQRVTRLLKGEPYAQVIAQANAGP